MKFEIKGQHYQVGKLTVFEQLKVARKLLPVLAGMMSDFNGIKDAAQSGSGYEALEKALPKIADALADMSEDDTNAIIHPCLKVVSRQHGKNWVPVFDRGELAFDDIDLFTVLQLVGRVVGDNLGSFLPAAPDSVTEAQSPQG